MGVVLSSASFGVTGKPISSEFIALIADKLQLRLCEQEEQMGLVRGNEFTAKHQKLRCLAAFA